MTTDEKKEYENQSPFMHNSEKWVFNTCMKTYSTSLLDVLSESYLTHQTSNNIEIPTKTCIPFLGRFLLLLMEVYSLVKELVMNFISVRSMMVKLK